MELSLKNNFMDNPKISIIAVNWWAKEFAKLLFRSLYSKSYGCNYEFILVDNSGEIDNNNLRNEGVLFEAVNTVVLKLNKNLGHGHGMDHGIKNASGEYILILDIDAHILLDEWDKKLISLFEENKDLKLATASDGGLLKPARPLAMFFRKDVFIANNISMAAKDCDGAKFDVGVHAYFKILSIYGDRSVYRLLGQKTAYNDVLGNEYALNGERFVYHNWYGTRWYNINGQCVHDQIDGVRYDDFKVKKDNLFKQVYAGDQGTK